MINLLMKIYKNQENIDMINFIKSVINYIADNDIWDVFPLCNGVVYGILQYR